MKELVFFVVTSISKAHLESNRICFDGKRSQRRDNDIFLYFGCRRKIFKKMEMEKLSTLSELVDVFLGGL